MELDHPGQGDPRLDQLGLMWREFAMDNYDRAAEKMGEPGFESWLKGLNVKGSESIRKRLLNLDNKPIEDAEMQRLFLEFFVDTVRTLYKSYEKPMATPGTYRQRLLDNVGYRWTCEWEQVWPPNKEELRTEVPHGQPGFSEKMSAIAFAVQGLKLDQKDFENVEERAKNNQKHGLFNAVIRFDPALRYHMPSGLASEGLGHGYVKDTWRHFLGFAAKRLYDSDVAYATAYEKDFWLGRVEERLGESLMGSIEHSP